MYENNDIKNIKSEYLYNLLKDYVKENDNLYKENQKLEARIRRAIDYLNEHRFNKVNELKKILEDDE